jgi:hypothetical protein
MARVFDRSSSQYLLTTSSPITTTPMTMACWWYTTDATVDQYLIACQASSGHFNALIAYGTDADRLQAYTWDGSGATAKASYAFSTNTWHHGAAVFAAGDDRRVFMDGGYKGTSSASQTPDSLTRIGIAANSFGSSGYLAGGMAEVAIWNATLSDEAIAVLSTGVSPLAVHPQDLVIYLPFVRDDDNCLISGISFTPGNSPTVGAHPRVIYPKIFAVNYENIVRSDALPAYLEGVVDARISQLAVEVLVKPNPKARVSQFAVELLYENIVRSDVLPAYMEGGAPPERTSFEAYMEGESTAVVSQVPVEVLVKPDDQAGRVSQAPVEVLVKPDDQAARVSQAPVEVLLENVERGSMPAYMDAVEQALTSFPAYLVTETKLEVAQAIAYVETEQKKLEVAQAMAYAETEQTKLEVAQALAYAEVQDLFSASTSLPAYLRGSKEAGGYGTVSITVSAGADDAFEANNGTFFNSTHVTLWLDSHTVSGFYFRGGFRFQDVTVPQGSPIRSANIQFNFLDTGADDINGYLAAEDVDDANDFSTEADVTTRWNTKKTSATVAWIENSLGLGYATSPDIKSVIQELVDRGGWKSGNSAVILFGANNDYYADCDVEAYENSGSSPAKLNIEYGVKQPAYLCGEESGTDTSDSFPAYLTGIVRDDTPAYLKGQANTSTDLSAYVFCGTSTSDSVPTYMFGQIGNTSSLSAFMWAALATSTPAYLSGGYSAVGSLGAYLKGKQATQSSLSAWLASGYRFSSLSAWMEGYQRTSLSAYLYCGTKSTSSYSAFTKAEVNATTSLGAYTASHIYTATTRPAYLMCGIAKTWKKSAFLKGEVNTLAYKRAYLRGKSSTTGTLDAYIKAGTAASDTQTAYLNAVPKEVSSYPVFLEGTVNFERTSLDAYTDGILGAAYLQSAYLRGGINPTTSFSAYMVGGINPVTSLDAYLYGRPLSTLNAYTRGLDSNTWSLVSMLT